MIRIVDILKKAEEKRKPEDKKPAETPKIKEIKVIDLKAVPELPEPKAEEEKAAKEFSSEELKRFFDEAFRLVEGLGKDKGKQAERILPAIEKLIDQQAFGIEGIIGALDEYPKEKELLVHAFKIAVYSIKLGIDANYDREKLEQLAAIAIFYDIEMAGNAAKGLVDNAAKNICINKESCEDIINLAELYVSNLPRP